jgi:hypothetical protein
MKGPDFIFRAVKKDLPDRALVGFCFLEPLPVGINEVNPSLSAHKNKIQLTKKGFRNEEKNERP